MASRLSKAKAMPPPPRRPLNRALSSTPSFNGRASPAESIASRARSPGQTAGTKRKEREFEQDGGEETSINVVVRCRGRNDREVRENSGVVVSTDGVKGRSVELSMGPSALSNKTYHFDKVFSPAADQIMVYDEVVVPILDEVLAGFNCTIFAYGQTGTGKTYTMSGDITDMLPLPDNAGIIPRVLHGLFGRLDGTDCENSVKISFIELYNEELRDLLSADDNVKLKIYEETNKRGGSSTLVQGMEESHITSFSKGIQLLREGSHKRQVAATKCNDLSSRSHTVFTVTVYMKRTSETGEDYISAGKLNLVDLAGSENIQRSGAENKRAAEAGLINKSLLTLGRVINALVDKGSHIPYRESKLTRLLQDSLGGRTKTCIIATLSPAKSNLEETISTLDYAFRAKNIRNKPQVNSMVSKKTLLKEFTYEIEKLKSELIATRQRNGVYLTQDSYDEMTTESESRRILSEEQRDKIETMEINLRNKVQELFSLTTNFNSLKKDNEMTRMMLDGTKSILERTEKVLELTRTSLADETAVRQAHQQTEAQLTRVGEDLLSTLGRTTEDIGGLQSKLRRRSDLHALNKGRWSSAQHKVVDTTSLIDDRLANLQSTQAVLIADLGSRMSDFVADELDKLGATQAFLQDKAAAFDKSQADISDQNAKSRDDLNQVLEEVKALREEVKTKVGSGLSELNAAAQRISAGILGEVEAFQTELHASYASLGRGFKSTFDDLIREMNDNRAEADDLRQRMSEANAELAERNSASAVRMTALLDEERRVAAEERQALLQQIGLLISSTAQRQEQRLEQGYSSIRSELDAQQSAHGQAQQSFFQDGQAWSSRTGVLVSKAVASRDNIKSKIKADFATATEKIGGLREVTSSVHDTATKIVADQVAHLDTELHALDDIVARIQDQNNNHHELHVESLAHLGANVKASYDNISSHFTTSFERIEAFGSSAESQYKELSSTLPTLATDAEVRTTLQTLREEIEGSALQDYSITGHTPQRTSYAIPSPSALPKTQPRELLLKKLRSGHHDASSPEVVAEAEEETTSAPLSSSISSDATLQPRPTSPTKGLIFTDANPLATGTALRPPSSSSSSSNLGSLRELDINTIAFTNGATPDSIAATTIAPPLKRQNTTSPPLQGTKLPQKRSGRSRMTVAAGTLAARSAAADERENLTVPLLSKSVGPGAERPVGLLEGGRVTRGRVRGLGSG